MTNREWFVGTDTSRGAARGRVHVMERDERGDLRTVAVCDTEDTATLVVALLDVAYAAQHVLDLYTPMPPPALSGYIPKVAMTALRQAVRATTTDERDERAPGSQDPTR